MTGQLSVTSMAAWSAVVAGGSVPLKPPPDQVMCQVTTARRVNLPSEAPRDVVVYLWLQSDSESGEAVPVYGVPEP